jgi:hypothetical protein
MSRALWNKELKVFVLDETVDAKHIFEIKPIENGHSRL